MSDRACTHCEGTNGELGEVPTAFKGRSKMHTFDREEDHYRGAWRWVCGCGAKGKWQMQSPNCSYHSWLDHVVRSG